MTRCAPGMTFAAISLDGGAANAHGGHTLNSKYTAPDKRTARNTSERTSVFMSHWRAPARLRHQDEPARGPQTICKVKQTITHGVDPGSVLNYSHAARKRGKSPHKVHETRI